MADRFTTSPQPESHRRKVQRTADAGARRRQVAARLRMDWWWIAILVICGSFQIYRGAPVDGVFFLGAGLALLADAAGWLGALDSYRLPRVRRAVAVTLGVIVVAIITFAPQWGLADLVVVGVVGATALIVAWRNDDTSAMQTPEERSADESSALQRAMRRSAVLWAAAGIFLCLWELFMFFLARPSAAAEAAHPVLSDLIDPIAANPLGRAVCAAVWIVSGVALLRRGRQL